jgi:hypothetical protein
MENSSDSDDLSFVKGFNKIVKMYVVASRVLLVAAITTETFLDAEEVLDVAFMYFA